MRCPTWNFWPHKVTTVYIQHVLSSSELFKSPKHPKANNSLYLAYSYVISWHHLVKQGLNRCNCPGASGRCVSTIHRTTSLEKPYSEPAPQGSSSTDPGHPANKCVGTRSHKRPSCKNLAREGRAIDYMGLSENGLLICFNRDNPG
jgi:hypothetical protein